VILPLLFLLIASCRLAEKEYKLNTDRGTRSWPPGNSFLIVYFITRSIFIIAYELWFRGFLLIDSVAFFGIPTALLLNVGLYALLHIVNGKREVLACIPFGLLLCFLCIWQGAAWPAIAIHLTLTLSYEISMTNKIITKSLTL
jgi:membrane protease YdiL (CAAX protease family)